MDRRSTVPEAGSAAATSGTVMAVRGSVVDVRFEADLPPIHTLLLAGTEGQIAIEVLAYLGCPSGARYRHDPHAGPCARHAGGAHTQGPHAGARGEAILSHRPGTGL